MANGTRHLARSIWLGGREVVLWGRAYYTLLTAIVLAFNWWLDCWNLPGFRY